MKLENKNILLGVTGGIAVYKALELVRLLVKQNASVNVVMTANAERFVGKMSFQALSGNPVLTDTFDLASGAEIKHISIPDDADIAVVAPATANFIGKIAHGIADDMLTTMMLAMTGPVLIAPSMNVHMYGNRIVQDNIKRLQQYGYNFIEPDEGWLACGYEGKGRLAEPEQIMEETELLLTKKDLKGRNILVTAGPTREYLDPVRFISNPSSGKMGYAIARAARMRGAHVTLVSGKVTIKPPYGVDFVEIESAGHMLERVNGLFKKMDAIVMTSAVSDFTPSEKSAQKIKKALQHLDIRLDRTADILSHIAKDKGRRIIVGFAAETDDMERYAREKLKQKRMDMIVANDITDKNSGFGVDTNKALLIFKDGSMEDLPVMQKSALADVILDRVASLFIGK
ncbi:MAG: bifunctional phosphopantothenoylcysteine decarboxylase/phosphopantothenate--cysteine ligase CoaBC [Deltaproteobacteria bacterium]|nr:bifunctional phosphopantothenoylcysteine decarboxylase/phosphopantothenate--cysteine ligase CoaBC [Deltaproteobacteria bacterium]MCL5277903.1 bifunctional phosphopantothenoylcysteine decarboxylase/phosphopantothenate--cysteine ligase CoaBC [Deltaproteobacteria bacterium]